MTLRAPRFPLAHDALTTLVRSALDEDRAFADVTTLGTVPEGVQVTARLVARREGRLSGLPLARMAFQLLDPAVVLLAHHEDGAALARGETVLEIRGAARGILSAERVALNFVQRLSGVASLTARFVAAIDGTRAHIVDTRKTTPGWRDLEKYAVTCGGGRNHRRDLSDAVLIKDNHIAACNGDIALAITSAREHAPKGMLVQVECDTVAQARTAIGAGADALLLDNMTNEALAECVRLAVGHCWTEASGGVSLDTVRSIAETGVDRISVGALTHSAPSLDLALDFE